MDTDKPAKLEFAVQMTCEACRDQVKAALEHQAGIYSVSVDVGEGRVLVETSLSSGEVQALIESTHRQAILKGMGSFEEQRDLGAAVAMLAGKEGRVQGVVRFLQLCEERCLIDGTIDGLEPGAHGLHVHALGDLTDDCLSTLAIWEIFSLDLKAERRSDWRTASLKYRARTHTHTRTRAISQTLGQGVGDRLQVWDVIGRSLVVDAGPDDLGRGGHPLSKLTGNSGARLACGIIARSAGLFQNPKQVCACDGLTLWEERERPIAGKGRSNL
ncbi:copper chaperone for superoxide dismutase isoform X1 [Hippocampus comes]|uniref:copper chaperone for superoxide dismutase isoform X1 n=1 Tax=Hippocampus comes TaxID=109280 RepID=UPI00094E2DAF|nr:PREDICTED: copper chaperone for superoxide dismutase isoform X1 [Hippocampus comes]